MSQTPFCVGLAGRTILIDTVSDIKYKFAGYESDQTPDFSLRVTAEDVAWERSISEREEAGSFSDSYLEMLAINRKTAEALISYSTFLMHGAVVAAGEDAFMFTARSGVGKTTHISKWLKNAPGAFVVNGDKPLIRLNGEYAVAYGSPWCGKEQLNTNIGVPLRAIVFMERSENNTIEEISFSQMFPTLLQQVYRPVDAELMHTTLSLLSALNGRVKFYHFRFNNMKPDAFRTSYEALTGKSAGEILQND